MTVRLGQHDTLLCERNLNILAHAQCIELEIGSLCGGHGQCGGDRIRLADPAARTQLSPPTEDERRHLTETELAHGWRLACQCYPEKDQLELSFDY